MAQAVVREASEGDLAALLALLCHLHPEDSPLDPDRAAEIWRAILRQRGLVVFLAELHGMPAASCTLAIIPNLSRGGRPYAIIENVVTHAEHRRQGLGRQVLAFALQRAWQEDCYKVMLATGSKRESTLRFYESSGFTRGSKTYFEARRP